MTTGRINQVENTEIVGGIADTPLGLHVLFGLEAPSNISIPTHQTCLIEKRTGLSQGRWARALLHQNSPTFAEDLKGSSVVHVFDPRQTIILPFATSDLCRPSVKRRLPHCDASRKVVI